MIKQDFYIANLIARYLSEEITPEETIKLTTWREESTAHEILFKKICDEENQKQHFRQKTAAGNSPEDPHQKGCRCRSRYPYSRKIPYKAEAYMQWRQPRS